MANPRPCVCGHVESDHTGLVPGTFVPCRRCWLTQWPDGDWCSRYRKRPRIEPLRAGPPTMTRQETRWRSVAADLASAVSEHLWDLRGRWVELCDGWRPDVEPLEAALERYHRARNA